MHPMHVHLVRFQILSKTDLTTGQPIPLEPWEANTWKDVVRVPANSRARIIMDFTDYLGRFPTHCHILDHEDHEMMRQFQTTNDPANCNNNGSCDAGEDCQSCPNDCAQVSGASCGNGLCEAGDGENCATCPADCAGKQKGSASKQFCCGFDDGQVNGPIGCGVDANDNRCIDASTGLACRVEARLSACCGDKLCEGAETIASCASRLRSERWSVRRQVSPRPSATAWTMTAIPRSMKTMLRSPPAVVSVSVPHPVTQPAMAVSKAIPAHRGHRPNRVRKRAAVTRWTTTAMA